MSFLICFRETAEIYRNGLPLGVVRAGQFEPHEHTLPDDSKRAVTVDTALAEKVRQAVNAMCPPNSEVRHGSEPLPAARDYAALVGELYCIASASRSHAEEARKLAERFDAAAVRVNRMAETLKELNDGEAA